MRFIFLIGVEGAGHGLMRSVLKPFLSLPTTVDQGGWHQPMVALWDSHNVEAVKTKCAIYARWEAKRASMWATHAFESASFPFGQPRDALRRPNIANIQEMIYGFGFEFVPIVIYRNFYDCVYSGIRRGFTDNVALQARIIQDNLFAIHQQLQSQTYVTVKFETLVKYPEVYMKPLAKILDVDQSIIEEGVCNIGSPGSAPKGFAYDVRGLVCTHSVDEIHTQFAMRDLEFMSEAQYV